MARQSKRGLHARDPESGVGLTSFNKFAAGINWKEVFAEARVSRPIYYTLSGSHLYGFNSKNSDIDIRGCHAEEIRAFAGLAGYHEVRELSRKELDFSSFDIKKEISLIMANNSNVLEHLSDSAVPVYKSKHYTALKKLAHSSISKLVAKPYWGMAQFNLHKYLRRFNEAYREAPTKKYLYVLRAYMAGIYVLEKGRIEPNIAKLNRMALFQLPIVDELVEIKRKGLEKDSLPVRKVNAAEEAVTFLAKRFAQAESETRLPNAPTTYEEANNLLLEIRLGHA